MDGLDVLEPVATTVTFNGKELKLSPLKVGQIPAFARHIKPISTQLGSAMTGKIDVVAIMGLLADSGDNIIEAVALASGVPADELRDTTPDKLIELAIAVVKVNADFFKGRLTPAILAAVKAVTPAPGGGPTL